MDNRLIKMSDLQQDYLKLTKELTCIHDVMLLQKDKYRDYLGWSYLDSPVFSHPDILFVGINPGPGRFIQWNMDNWDKKAKKIIDPLNIVIPPDSAHPWRSHLQWTIPDNAREKGEWWDVSKKRKNFLPLTMCELLVRIFRYEFPTISRKELTDVFEQRVMVTNLYPMATFDVNKLNHLINLYDKENGANIRHICHGQIQSLIALVKPKLVVLLGDTVTHELYDDLRSCHLPFYGICRKRGWHNKENIRFMADEIHLHLISNPSID